MAQETFQSLDVVLSTDAPFRVLEFAAVLMLLSRSPLLTADEKLDTAEANRSLEDE